MNKCKKRYHRALFHWLLAAVGANNVFVAFRAFMEEDDYAALKKRHNGRSGFIFNLKAQGISGTSLRNLGTSLLASFPGEARAHIAQFRLFIGGSSFRLKNN